MKTVRETIIDMILGTDMQQHAKHMKNLQTMTERRNREKRHSRRRSTQWIDKDSDRNIVLVVGLHLSDIANPCYKWNDYFRWTKKLIEEWYKQGDRERALNLPVSPMMDRHKPNVPRGQVGFIDYIVKPLLGEWIKLFPATATLNRHLQENRDRWAAELEIAPTKPIPETPSGIGKRTIPPRKSSKKVEKPIVDDGDDSEDECITLSQWDKGKVATLPDGRFSSTISNMSDATASKFNALASMNPGPGAGIDSRMSITVTKPQKQKFTSRKASDKPWSKT